MWRGCVGLLVLLAACTSAWRRHEKQLHEDEAQRDYVNATGEAQWLVDHAFEHAPFAERSEVAEADRYVRLAEVASKSGNHALAVSALRRALFTDPDVAPAVRTRLSRLSLRAEDRQRLAQEFGWNMAALAPAASDAVADECWSYRVREVRVRRRRTVGTAHGMERQLTYDAREWRFDAERQDWQPESEWRSDSGTETQPIHETARPHFRALDSSDHQFLATDGVPPCHRLAWSGPFDADGRLFVTPHLPGKISDHAR